MSAAALTAFFDREFPQLTHDGVRAIVVENVSPMAGSFRLVHHERHLRPGGTISGPAMFTLADVALYATILAQVGPLGLVMTTNMTMNFLRKPAARDLMADCRLLKFGRRLAMGEVVLRSAGAEEAVAHATGTYAIPSGSRVSGGTLIP